MDTIDYFAYGSNMSSRRLSARLPTCVPIGAATLSGYRLEFHKPSMKDGSGKCGISVSEADEVHGVIFRINSRDKVRLDAVEGVGHGYVATHVLVATASNNAVRALTYCATVSDPLLSPFTWYKRHVLEGAREFALPADYIEKIEGVHAIADPSKARETLELKIYA